MEIGPLKTKAILFQAMVIQQLNWAILSRQTSKKHTLYDSVQRNLSFSFVTI